jgi:hypothetical protein
MRRTGDPMDYFYLDIGPMIRRLQQNPSEFEIRRNCIRHRPSRHRLVFDRGGRGRIAAQCNRVEFPVSRDQGVALRVAIENWQHHCSRPLVARDPVAQATSWVYLAFSRYLGLSTRWRQALDIVFRWVVIVAQGSRPAPRTRLRIVSLRTDDARSDGGVSHETRSRRGQKVVRFQEVAGPGQATSPTTSSRHERLL